MNPLLSNIILSSAAKKARRKKSGRTSYSNTRRRMKSRASATNRIKEMIFLVAGVFSAGYGLKGFLIPNKFIDGGVTGISLLLNQLTGFSLSLLLILVNIPFIVLAFRQVNRMFALKTVLAILGLAACVEFIPYPEVDDKLLIAVFGGFFLGGGIGLAIRGGAVLDGTEVLAIYLNKRTNLSIGDIILIFNSVIFTVAAFVLSLNIALYAILTYFVASKMVDFIVEGIEEYVGVTIISHRNEEICAWLTDQMDAGFTVYKGVSGYGKSGHVARDTNIIYTVITRLEISRLRSEIKNIDPRAFIIMNTVIDARGGMIKRRVLKKLQKPEIK